MDVSSTEARVQPPLVLIADDDRALRALLGVAMEEEGYRVAEARDGEQCLVEYDRVRPDVVLLDAVMPQMDGFDCCRHLRQRPGGDRVPILTITVLDDPESVDRAFEAGATDYITKPIHWPVLSQRVRRLLAASESMKAMERAQQALQSCYAWENLWRACAGWLAEPSEDRWLSELLERARALLAADETVLLEGKEICGAIAEATAVEDIEDFSVPTAIEAWRSRGARSALLAPVRTGDRVRAVLGVEQRSRRRWSELERARWAHLALLLGALRWRGLPVEESHSK